MEITNRLKNPPKQVKIIKPPCQGGGDPASAGETEGFEL